MFVCVRPLRVRFNLRTETCVAKMNAKVRTANLTLSPRSPFLQCSASLYQHRMIQSIVAAFRRTPSPDRVGSQPGYSPAAGSPMPNAQSSLYPSQLPAGPSPYGSQPTGPSQPGVYGTQLTAGPSQPGVYGTQLTAGPSQPGVYGTQLTAGPSQPGLYPSALSFTPGFGTPGALAPHYGTPGALAPHYGTAGALAPHYGTPGAPNYGAMMPQKQGWTNWLGGLISRSPSPASQPRRAATDGPLYSSPPTAAFPPSGAPTQGGLILPPANQWAPPFSPSHPPPPSTPRSTAGGVMIADGTFLPRASDYIQLDGPPTATQQPPSAVPAGSMLAPLPLRATSPSQHHGVASGPDDHTVRLHRYYDARIRELEEALGQARGGAPFSTPRRAFESRPTDAGRIAPLHFLASPTTYAAGPTSLHRRVNDYDGYEGGQQNGRQPPSPLMFHSPEVRSPPSWAGGDPWRSNSPHRGRSPPFQDAPTTYYEQDGSRRWQRGAPPSHRSPPHHVVPSVPYY
mgnify:FL=1